MGIPNIQLGDIPSPYETRKVVIDYRNLPICIDHIEDTGFLRKRYVYYHNYGTYVQIIIVMIPMMGKPTSLSYRYDIKKRRKRPLRVNVRPRKTDPNQYVV